MRATCRAGPSAPPLLPGKPSYTGLGSFLPLKRNSLVAQLGKNPPAMRETWVPSLGGGRFPGEGKGYPLLGLENSMDCIVHGVAKSQTGLSDFHFHFPLKQRSAENQRVGWHHRLNVFEQKLQEMVKDREAWLLRSMGVAKNPTHNNSPLNFLRLLARSPCWAGGCSDKGSGLGLEKPIKETFPPARRWALEAAGSQLAQGPSVCQA